VQRHQLQDVSWRFLKPQEHAEHIIAIIQTARQLNPALPVLLTLSPIPVRGSFTHDSVMATDCISKSSLRIAVEIVLESGIEKVSYWPAFEAIRWLSAHSGPVFGVEDAYDNRHLATRFVRAITDSFVEFYYVPKSPA
jgi:hypothetical protein